MILKIDPDPKFILDVGPGAGQWFDLLRQWFPKATFDAVEIFQPYVERYRLSEKYNTIFVGDIREWMGGNLSHWFFDLVIFGDVIEHMAKPEAIEVVRRLLHEHALISIPIGPCPQDPTEENPHEEHVATWETNEILDTFPVIDYFAYKYPPPHYGRGVFLLEKP